MLTLPDLNKCKVFYVVYKTGNLVKAAEALNITRSAISQALKALEEELETKLFIRDSKKVLATEPGHLLYQSIEPFFAELESTIRALETGRREAVGHLRIGAPQDFGSTHLTEAVVAFHRRHPRITFELILATPVTLLEQLSTGHLDMAFIDNGDFHAKNYPVSIFTVMKENFIPVCSPQYFDKAIKHINLDYNKMRSFEFIDYLVHAPVVKMWFKHKFGKVPPNPNITFSAESVRSLIKAAEGGLGVAILPDHLVKLALECGSLKCVFSREKENELVNQITLARRVERPVTVREREFVEFYKNTIMKFKTD